MKRLLILCTIATISTHAVADCRLRIRGDLSGKRIVVRGRSQHPARLLGGSSAINDGAWLDDCDQNAVSIEPSSQRLRVDSVRTPPALSDGWRIVPVPLSAWGVGSVDELAFLSLSVSSKRRMRASSFRPLEAKARGEEVEPVVGAALPKTARHDSEMRGLWVWNTKEVVSDARPLLEVAATWKINTVFLQLPDRDEVTDAQLANLLTTLHSRKIKVHALDGAPWYALDEARSVVTAIASRVDDFNSRAAEPGRFDALHLDIEPYLLPLFGGKHRAELMQSYASTLEAVKKTSSLPLWIDIPFWFDTTAGPAINPHDVSTRHFLDRALGLVDGVVVMSYRTEAVGRNGVVGLTANEAKGAKRNHIEIAFALETIQLPAESAWVADLREPATPRAGRAQLLVPKTYDGYVLFNDAPTARDAAWLLKNQKYRAYRADFERGADPKRLTFHGRPGHEVMARAEEALEGFAVEGAPVNGVAFHELRSLRAKLDEVVGRKNE